MSSPPSILRLKRSHWRQMREHVESEDPLEACGLVGGQSEQAEVVIPVTNIAGSAVRFRMDPTEQIQAMLQIEASGWELLGIYHSHPAGPSGPSATDLQEAAYPEAAYLIWFREGQTWSCQAFDLMENPGEGIPIVVEEG